MVETGQILDDPLSDGRSEVTERPLHRPVAPSPSVLRRWVPLLGALGPGVLLSLWYVQRTYVDMVLLDGFIHIPHIGEALQPGGTVADLVRSPFAGEHLLLGYRLLLFANAKLFALDMRLDPIMFIAAFAVTATVLYAEFARVFTGLRTVLLLVAFLPLGFLCFSLVAPPLILMATQFVLGATVALVIGWLVQRDLAWADERSRSFRRPLWSALALVPVYFLLSGAYFAGLLLGIGAMYLFRRLLEHRAWLERRFVILGSVLLAGSATYMFFMVKGLAAQGRPTSGNLTLPFADIRGFLLSYPAGVGAGLLDSHTLEGTSSSTVLAVGTSAILLIVLSLWLFVRMEMYRKSYLPVYCIFYTLGIITVVQAARGGMSRDLGWRWITAEWYSFHLRFAVIGVAWILISATLEQVRRVREDGSSFAVLPLTLTALAAVFVGTCHFIGNRAQWERARHVKAYYGQKQVALLYPELFDDPEKVLLWPADQLAISRAVLERHSLSTFSPEGRAEVARRLEGQPLRSSEWHEDGWVGRNAKALLVARTARPVELRAYGPEFIPSNHCEFRLNDELIFAGEIRGGSTTPMTGRLRPQSNIFTVACDKASSPRALGVGADDRSLAVRVTVR